MGDRAGCEQVSRVFKRLVQVSHHKHLPWEVHVLDIGEFQAFTIGGGKVFVFSRLFQPNIGVQSDDELAAVRVVSSNRVGGLVSRQFVDGELHAD